MSVFSFIDEVVELKKNEKVTVFYSLKGDEGFLEDHFKGFPVMPGVLLLESVKQAASLLLTQSGDFNGSCFRLVSADDIKYGQFVKPGAKLSVSARLVKKEGSERRFDGRIDVINGNGGSSDTPLKAKALTCSFTLAPVNWNTL